MRWGVDLQDCPWIREVQLAILLQAGGGGDRSVDVWSWMVEMRLTALRSPAMSGPERQSRSPPRRDSSWTSSWGWSGRDVGVDSLPELRRHIQGMVGQSNACRLSCLGLHVASRCMRCHEHPDGTDICPRCPCRPRRQPHHLLRPPPAPCVPARVMPRSSSAHQRRPR